MEPVVSTPHIAKTVKASSRMPCTREPTQGITPIVRMEELPDTGTVDGTSDVLLWKS